MNLEKQIISASEDRKLIFWDKDYSIRRSHNGFSAYRKLIELKKRGYIAAGRRDGEIEIFDKKTTNIKFTLNKQNNNIISELHEANSGGTNFRERKWQNPNMEFR